MTNRREFLKKTAAAGAAVTLIPGSITGRNTKAPTFLSNVPVSNDPGDTYTVSARSAMNIPSIQPRDITIPDTGGFKVLKGDFHIHTLFSDGDVMPADRVREAVQNGLDVIAITDHIEVRPFFSTVGRWKLNDEQGLNYNLSYEIAKPEAEKKDRKSVV